MAPLWKAISVQYVRDDADAKVYQGVVDSDWTIGSVPNGGYVLALILQACIEHQSSTSHRDPIHVTAHYLRTTSKTAFEVRIKALKTGKGFTNLTAELVQEDQLKVVTHIIFGSFASTEPAHAKLKAALSPPSRFARKVPLYRHPSNAPPMPMRKAWGFHRHSRWTEEPEVHTANQAMNAEVGGGGLEWGSWFELTDKDERITTASLAFLVDMFVNTPMILSKISDVGLPISWFPTMTLAIEFKHPIPQSEAFAKRTVGLYSSGKYLNDPSGHHDIYAEVWTAPCNIGEGQEQAGWRDNQRCLAVATQMALVVPFEVNTKSGEKSAARL
ncbi:hypothetical protein HGRIS_005818 [Hohenbuehelia grisea]|uniref:Thioesterase family protein n=1 Tax=Hohenbuehelia grisea TaxID=104357 RepID=A0ABR3JYW9_9AGAR